MTTKPSLREIKAAVAAVANVDPWHTDVSWDDDGLITAVMRVGEFDLGTTANDTEENILTLLGNSRDYLKALLAVVEKSQTVVDVLRNLKFQDPLKLDERKAFDELLDALKALDG